MKAGSSRQERTPALLTGEPRGATVRTTMPTELYSLARADFLALLDHDTGVAQAVRETIAARRQALAEAARAADPSEEAAAETRRGA
jgi:CRP-like cAMP-binding protein